MGKLTAQSGLAAVIKQISTNWAEQVETIRNHVPGLDTYTLERSCELAKVTAERIKSEHFKSRADNWKTFVADQIKSGAAAAHRLVKRDGAKVGDSATVGEGTNRTASPQAIIDQDLNEWRKIWTRLGDTPTAPWRDTDIEIPMLPPITVENLRKASNSFNPDTGIGCDGFPLAAIATLSDQLLECIAMFLNYVERTGYWPEAIATALIHLIPKADGGRRPTGVLPTIVRVWERVRKNTVQNWLRQHARSYDWATQGRSAESAA